MRNTHNRGANAAFAVKRISMIAICLILAGFVLTGCKAWFSSKTNINANTTVTNTDNTNQAGDIETQISFALSAQNNSGEQGVAMITDEEGGVQVELNLTGAAGISNQPAHIHTGSCATLGGVKYPLNPVTDGKSTTMISGLTIQALLDQQPLAINVHKSAAEAGVYVSCGEVKAGTVVEQHDETNENSNANVNVNVGANLNANVNVNANLNANVSVSTKTVTITAKNFSFSPSEIRVKKGDKVKVILNDTEGVHDFIIDAFTVATNRINTGETTSVEFTASKTGTFEYYCSVGTHRQMGMHGNLIVE